MVSNKLRATAPHGRMAPVPADALIAAVCRRDFDAVARLLTPDVRMHAVLPSRYLEAIGDEVVASFKRWFESAERFDVISAGSDDMAGRALVQWRFHVAPHPLTRKPGWHEIEQIAFIDTAAGLVSGIDLVSSGYRPLPQPWVQCGGWSIADEPSEEARRSTPVDTDSLNATVDAPPGLGAR